MQEVLGAAIVEQAVKNAKAASRLTWAGILMFRERSEMTNDE
jgi:hypothetical protein